AATSIKEIEELGRVRPLRVDGRALIVERVSAAERAPLVEFEVPGAWTLDREAPNGHPVDLVEPRGEVALPRQVVGRVSRRDLHREVRSQPLDHRAGMRLRTARNVSVALHDDEQARVAQLAT